MTIDPPQKFPRFLFRFKAAIWDGLFLALTVYLAFLAPAFIGVEHTGLKVTLIALIITLYEPIWVTVSGGSVGHHMAGVRVISLQSGGNLSLPASVCRSFCRYIFGIYSFLTMLITKRHQALHDGIVNSVVVFKKPEEAVAYNVLIEREIDYAETKPSVMRRLLVFIIYFLLFLTAWTFFYPWIVSEKCINNLAMCTKQEEMLSLGASLVLLIVAVALLVLALRCKLSGARYVGQRSTK